MRYPLPLTALALATLALVGCAQRVVRTLPHDGPARLGETVRVGGPSVRPVEVLEDSRCPADARCVWAGRLVLRAIVSGGRWSRPMDLTLGQPTQVADGMLTLVSALPEKSATCPAIPHDYRFAFAFQGGI